MVPLVQGRGDALHSLRLLSRVPDTAYNYFIHCMAESTNNVLNILLLRVDTCIIDMSQNIMEGRYKDVPLMFYYFCSEG